MRTTRPTVICLAVLALATLTACNPASRAKEAKVEVDSGNAAACVQERALLQTAVEAATLMAPDAPLTEAAMVSGGFLHSESRLMDVRPDGTVVAAPGSVCT
jgi:hypothetical protein